MVGLVFFFAFSSFAGWQIFAALAVELALPILLCHVYRRLRYPGLLESKSSGKLAFEIVLSILPIYILPWIAILAKFHVAGFIPFDKIAVRLGLKFKFKVRDLVVIASTAPCHSGEHGRITKIHVATTDLNSPIPIRAGEVIFAVQLQKEIVEIPERLVFRAVR